MRVFRSLHQQWNFAAAALVICDRPKVKRILIPLKMLHKVVMVARSPQILARDGASSDPFREPPQHDPQRVVEKNCCIGTRPRDITLASVIAIDDPLFRASLLLDPFAKFMRRPVLPASDEILRVKFDVLGTDNADKRLGQRRFAAACTAEDK